MSAETIGHYRHNALEDDIFNLLSKARLDMSIFFDILPNDWHSFAPHVVAVVRGVSSLRERRC